MAALMQSKTPTVIGLFTKAVSGQPPIAPSSGRLQLKSRWGIESDADASGISPRQLLITNQAELDVFGIAPGELLENITVSGLDSADFVPGSILHIGDEVQIRLTFYCEPCKRIGHLVPALSDILRKRGILGVVLQGGQIQVGDSVVAESKGYPALSEIPYERFLHYIGNVPEGKVVTYTHILKGIGVTHGYYRALPGYIRRTSHREYPLHRIVDTQGRLILDYVPDQVTMLTAEGVDVIGLDGEAGELDKPSVDISSTAWEDEYFYTMCQKAH